METENYHKTKDKITIGNAHISITTLNVNRLNSPIKGTQQQIGSKNKIQPNTAFRRNVSFDI